MALYNLLEELRVYLGGVTPLPVYLGTVDELLESSGNRPDQFITIAPSTTANTPSDTLLRGTIHLTIVIGIYVSAGEREVKNTVWELALDSFESVLRAVNGYELSGFQLVEPVGTRIVDTDWNAERYEIETILNYNFNDKQC